MTAVQRRHSGDRTPCTPEPNVPSLQRRHSSDRAPYPSSEPIARVPSTPESSGPSLRRRNNSDRVPSTPEPSGPSLRRRHSSDRAPSSEPISPGLRVEGASLSPTSQAGLDGSRASTADFNGRKAEPTLSVTSMDSLPAMTFQRQQKPRGLAPLSQDLPQYQYQVEKRRASAGEAELHFQQEPTPTRGPSRGGLRRLPVEVGMAASLSEGAGVKPPQLERPKNAFVRTVILPAAEESCECDSQAALSPRTPEPLSSPQRARSLRKKYMGAALSLPGPTARDEGTAFCDPATVTEVLQGLECSVVNFADRVPLLAARNLPGTTAVLSGFGTVPLVHEWLKRAAAAPDSGPKGPTLVVLLLESGQPVDAAVVVELQRALCLSGADDVLLNMGTRELFKAVVGMSLARLGMQEARKEAWARQATAPSPPFGHECAAGTFPLRPEERGDPKSVLSALVRHLFDELPRVEPATDGPLQPKEGLVLASCRLDCYLGRGACGAVWAATNEDSGAREALKFIDKSSLDRLDRLCPLWTEVKLLQRLRHPRIVGLRGILDSEEHLIVRMEHAGTCNMWRAFQAAGGRFHTEVAKKFLAQLSNAVSYIHSQDIAHRDLKPENIAVSDDGLHIKVLDFGCATKLQGPCLDMAGTMPFIAPEVLEADGCDDYCPAGMDVWAAGVLLLEMLCGAFKLNRMLGWEEAVTPEKVRAAELRSFFSGDAAAVVERALQADLRSVEPELLDLAQSMLQVDAGQRATAQEVEASAWLRKRRPHKQR